MDIDLHLIDSGVSDFASVAHP